jgi:hypothetical protein
MSYRGAVIQKDSELILHCAEHAQKYSSFFCHVILFCKIWWNIWCGYNVPGMILLHILKGAMHLIVVKTCMWMFQLAPVTVSTN